MTPYEKVKAWRESFPPEELRRIRRAEAKKYYDKYREKINAYKKSWRENHEDIELIKAREAANARRRRRTNPELARARMKKFKDKQERILIEIAGRVRPTICELCEESAKTVFDHDHATGKFRGWICDRCNRVLGSVKDSIPLLEKMSNYIKTEGIGHGETHIRTEESSTIIDFRGAKSA